MDGSPNYFGNDIQDIEDEENELFDSQHIMAQYHDYHDTSSTVRLGGSSIDAPLDQTHIANPLPINSINAQRPGKHTIRRTGSQLAASQSDSAKPTSPSLSSGSSETPETRYSQQIATPEDVPANTIDKQLHASVDDLFPPPERPQTKRRRTAKQQVEEDDVPPVDATKRNRFLERNRVAATKCRQKKKEWVSDLEETRFGLESQNNHLQMEYSNLRDEITHIKSQLMEHASCSDRNIDKWIENEAKRFVLGTGERYDQMLVNMGSAPGMMSRQDSFSSVPGYPTGPGSELISPVTPSNRGNISFPPGAMGPSSPIFYRPDMTPGGPDAAASVAAEETYPPNLMPGSMAEDPNGFDSVPMVDDTFED